MQGLSSFRTVDVIFTCEFSNSDWIKIVKVTWVQKSL